MPIALTTNLPDHLGYIYAGNLPDLNFTGIDAEAGMDFVVKDVTVTGSAVVILQEQIMPDAEGKATIKIKNLLINYLKVEKPNVSDFKQPMAVRLIQLLDGSGSISKFFYVVKGGLLIPYQNQHTYDYELFFQTNILSWTPSEHRVKHREPFFINYLHTYATSSQLRVRYYFKNALNATITGEYTLVNFLKVLDHPVLYTVNASISRIYEHVTQLENGEVDLFAVELFVSKNDVQVSNTQRLLLSNRYDENDDVFGYENTLGGFETIRLFGQLSQQDNHKTNSHLDDEFRLIEHETQPLQVFRKESGYFAKESERKWLSEFLLSNYRWHLRFDDIYYMVFERIVVLSTKSETKPNEINNFEFTFRFSDQRAWKMHQRDPLNEINDEDISIVYPGDVPALLGNNLNDNESSVFVGEQPAEL